MESNKDLDIIIDDESEENFDVKDYTNNTIKKFMLYNRDDLEGLRDVIKVINDNFHQKLSAAGRNPGRRMNLLMVNRFTVEDLIIDIGGLLERDELDLLWDFRLVYGILRFLTLKLDLMIQDLRIEITDEQIEELHSIEERLVPRIQKLTQDLQDHYFKKSINIDYFIYLNMNNPMVLASVNNVKPTPGTFRLYQVLDNIKIDELVDKFKYSFVDSTSHFGMERGIRLPGTTSKEKRFDPYRTQENWDHARANHLGTDYSTDPEFKKYTGWTKKALREALTEAGIFDSNVTPVEDGYLHQFPRLQELGISQPPVIKSVKPGSIIRSIPKYALEVLYAKSQNVKADWQEILELNPSVDLLRKLVKEEFHLDIEDDDELKLRVVSLARNQELSSELPAFSRDLIMQPGTPTHPGIMYTKMAPQIERFGKPGEFVRPRVDIEKYLVEIGDVCADPTKNAYNAYQLAVDIGLQNYVRIKESKERICQVLDNYLRVIRDERIY